MDTETSDINDRIEAELTVVATVVPLRPLRPNPALVDLYVRKIEGLYNVEGAKRDTDYANDLLYIAYNTTPQDCDEVRNQIDRIMDALVLAQRSSMSAMERAILKADAIGRELDAGFKEWKTYRGLKGSAEDVAAVKEFVKSELLEMAKLFMKKALEVKTDLDTIAAGYDKIIASISTASAQSQTALAKRMKDAEAVKAEINKAEARRKALESLVADLKSEVDKYDGMARDFAERAATAEQRAFIMSIVQVGAQMLAAAIPAVVSALTASASGGTSVLAAAAANTVKHAVGDKNHTPPATPANDAEIAKLKVDMANKQAAVTESDGTIAALKKELGELERQLEKELAAGKPPVAAAPGAARVAPVASPAPAAPAAPATGSTPAPQPAPESPAVQAFRAQIDKKQAEVKKEEDRRALLVGALSGLHASLAALDKGLGRLTEKQENTAAELRVMQMKMLDKVEAYEKERRTQNAELAQIKALLTGHLSDQAVAQLAVQSLNLSITALKRSQEIVRELAAFFLSFANFMQAAVEETEFDIRQFDKFVARGSVPEPIFRTFLETTDRFFFGRAAEWSAVKGVSSKFSASFNEGCTKLTKLQGNYLHGNQLEAYLKLAGARIDEIVAERDRASRRKLISLEEFRRQVNQGTLVA